MLQHLLTNIAKHKTVINRRLAQAIISTPITPVKGEFLELISLKIFKPDLLPVHFDYILLTGFVHIEGSDSNDDLDAVCHFGDFFGFEGNKILGFKV
jgi:hypothetical protein